MLVLSRHEDERIELQDAVTGKVITTIVIVEVRKQKGSRPKVRLGFEAGDEIKIHRKEVADAIRRAELEPKGTDHANAREAG